MNKKALFLFMFLLVIGFASPVFATTSAAWLSGIEKIQEIVSGPLLKAIALIMIVGGGVWLAWSEGQGVGKMGWIVVGLGIATGAASFYQNIVGNATGMLI